MTEITSKKTFNDLKVGDMLYYLQTDKIIEHEIIGIEPRPSMKYMFFDIKNLGYTIPIETYDGDNTLVFRDHDEFIDNDVEDESIIEDLKEGIFHHTENIITSDKEVLIEHLTSQRNYFNNENNIKHFEEECFYDDLLEKVDLIKYFKYRFEIYNNLLNSLNNISK